jgi:hypothetical protein
MRLIMNTAIKFRDIDAQKLEIQGGGGPWDFWQILLRGVLEVVRKLEGGGSFLLHFYVEVFQNLYRGYMRCPPPLPCVHLCLERWSSLPLHSPLIHHYRQKSSRF